MWKLKTFLQKVTFQIGVKKFLWLKKLKTDLLTNVISDLNGDEIVGTFKKKKW